MLKVLNNPNNIICIMKLNTFDMKCLYNNKRKNGSHDAVIIASFHTRVNTDVNIALVFFRNLCREINVNAKKHPDRNARLCFDDVATRTIGSRRSFPDVCPETASLSLCLIIHCIKVMNSESYAAMSSSTSRGRLHHSNALLCTMGKKEGGGK